MSLTTVTSVHCDSASCGAWEYVSHGNGKADRSNVARDRRDRARRGWRSEVNDGQRQDFCPECAPKRAGVDQMKLFDSQRITED